MQIRPVRRVQEPQYPTSAVLLEHPELLEAIPERWRGNPLVLRVLAGTLSLAVLGESYAVAQKPVNPGASHVAPLFVHGDGRGAFGCVAINPPVFLSEDEAKQVIVEEAKKAGIDFAPNALTLKQVSVPITEEYFCSYLDDEKKNTSRPPATQQLNLVLSGYDQKHNIAFELVASEEYKAWSSKLPRCISSVSSYDFKETAETLRKELSAAEDVPWIGVFYEPGATVKKKFSAPANASEADWKAAWDKREKQIKAIGREELRKQVQDFMVWLKAQGVI